MGQDTSGLRIGWAATDVTPERPVLVSGQFHARVSEGVMDPVTATALALESEGTGPAFGPVPLARGQAPAQRRAGASPPASPPRAVMVSCDFVAIPNGLREEVRNQVRQRLPELDPLTVFLNATHTHAGPEVRVEGDAAQMGGGNVPTWPGVDLEVMSSADYVAFASKRIAEAVERAWKGREPGGIGFGMGHAVVGHNRRISYYSGETRMYGKTDDPEFSHVEGYEDHSVNVLGTWNKARRLTGVVVNVACPSQVSESSYLISADYWHEVRVELRRRLGADLFVLAQNSAAGDQSPHILIGKRAEERMWRLVGRSQRQDIGVRVADAVAAVVPHVEKEVDWNPRFAHRVEMVPLLRRNLTEQDAKDALAEAAKLREQYEALRRDLEAHPEKRREPRWYVGITAAYRKMKWNESVATRFDLGRAQPKVPVEIHVMRLGDVALATNPFEYYLDFGMQIKARSKAVQTFLVQHVGSGAYVPTLRATAGRSYGAIPASTPVGSEGGRELAQWTVDAINALWGE